MSMGRNGGFDNRSGHNPLESDDDPFAELERMISETDVGEISRRSMPAKAAPRQSDHTGFDAVSFAGALSAEMEDLVAGEASERGWSAVSFDRQAAAEAASLDAYSRASGSRGAHRAADGKSSPTGGYDDGRVSQLKAEHDRNFAEAFNDELEIALRGLSTPQDPRTKTVHQSEAYAPERVDYIEIPDIAEEPLDDFSQLIASEMAAMNAARTAPVQEAEETFADDGRHEGQYDRNFVYQDDRDRSEYAPYTGASSGAYGAGQLVRSARSPRASRVLSLCVSAIVVASLAGGAAWVLSGDAGIVGSGEVLIVKADADPVKIKPENPGGRMIPNQNKAVYERVQSAEADMVPKQTKLVSTIERPIDPPAPEANDLPGVDLNPIASANAAERLDPEQQDVAANTENQKDDFLQPKRVRTLVVGPDGSLIPSSADVATDGPTIDNASAMLPAASKPLTASSGGASTAADVGEAASSMQDDPAMSVASIAPVPAEPAPVQPQAAPAAPEVDVAKTAEPAGYYVQIASQPSEEAAKESQKRLGQRYASAIGSHDIVIQSAEIAGKGTYYRVKVAAASKDEASTLCSKVKSAGGSCYVTR